VKQILQQRRGLTVVSEVPAPQCGPGMVLVSNVASVISSGTERAAVTETQKSLFEKARAQPEAAKQVLEKVRSEGLRETRRFVERKLDESIALGYSSAGTVLEVGAAVKGIKPGDTVACAGVGHASHAEVVAVPSNLCARVPAGVAVEQAAFATLGSIALHGVRLAEAGLGERIAVIGCGLIGQIATRLLVASGADVIAIDLDFGKANRATTASGARHGLVSNARTVSEVMELSGGLGVDATVVTAAAKVNAPLVLAAEITRARGSVVLVGDVPIELPRAPMYSKEIKFQLSCSYGPGRYDPSYELHGIDYPVSYVRWTEQRNMQLVLDLLASGSLSFGDLIEEVVDVADAPGAYQRIADGSAGDKGAIVIRYRPSDATMLRSERRQSDVIDVSTAEAERETSRLARAPRIGLLGPGAFATGVLIPALKATDAVLEGVAGGGGPSAVNAQSTFGFAKVMTSPEEMLDSPDIDGVVIATRHGAHAAQAARALRSDKHVLVEKPLALSAKELDDVLEAAVGSAGTLTVGFNRRFSPFLKRAREHLAGAGPMTATYRVAAGRIPETNWVHDLAVGGGRLLGEGCHFIDSLRFLADSPIVEVHAIGYGTADLPRQAADNLTVMLRFADGGSATVIYSADAAPGIPKERVEASRNGRTAILDDYRSLSLWGHGSPEQLSSKTVDKGHREEVRQFVGAAAGRDDAPMSLDEIRNVTLANLAAVRSLLEGRSIAVD